MDQPISKIQQFYPAKGLGTYTIALFGDKVVTKWKNMFGQFERSIALKDIKPEYDKARQSYDTWDNLIWCFLGIAIFINLFRSLSNSRNFVGVFVSLLVALFFFCLKFKKYDRAYFVDNQNIFLFAIRISKRSGIEKAFVDRLVMEINKARG
jgi:hypothetical protein